LTQIVSFPRELGNGTKLKELMASEDLGDLLDAGRSPQTALDWGARQKSRRNQSLLSAI